MACLRQGVVRLVARRLRGNRSERVGAARRADRPLAGGPTTQERRYDGGGDGGGAALVGFQRPLLNAAVNLPQIVDAGVRLRGGAGFDEDGDGDRSQKAAEG